MAGFAKLSSDLVTSSLWSEDDKTRIMFITMLAMADAQGYVPGTLPGMADMSRMSQSDAEKALGILMAPDPYSRSPEGEGVRVIKADGGFLLTGYARYRAKRDPEVRRQQNLEAQARFRAKNSDSKQIVSQSKPMSAQAEDRRQKQKSEAEEETTLKGSKEISVLFDLKRFDSWAGAKSEILKAFPKNRTIEKLLGRIIAGKDAHQMKLAVRSLYEICQEISKPGVKNPGGLLNKKLTKRFNIKTGVKL